MKVLSNVIFIAYGCILYTTKIIILNWGDIRKIEISRKFLIFLLIQRVAQFLDCSSYHGQQASQLKLCCGEGNLSGKLKMALQ